ncbi:hypothetical protein E2C01_000476 [Portunus trituberculatus]|uniref:Uncharacterized protein n=1 Tax=Portunus trituberculatus TaxID=210409 RepID=A0A5B7CFD0_PORTR|nr:hypothetical protein [Portunus trituberculatus]
MYIYDSYTSQGITCCNTFGESTTRGEDRVGRDGAGRGGAGRGSIWTSCGGLRESLPLGPRGERTTKTLSFSFRGFIYPDTVQWWRWMGRQVMSAIHHPPARPPANRPPPIARSPPPTSPPRSASDKPSRYNSTLE